jgi:hypothetical protein
MMELDRSNIFLCLSDDAIQANLHHLQLGADASPLTQVPTSVLDLLDYSKSDRLTFPKLESLALTIVLNDKQLAVVAAIIQGRSPRVLRVRQDLNLVALKSLSLTIVIEATCICSTASPLPASLLAVLDDLIADGVAVSHQVEFDFH